MNSLTQNELKDFSSWGLGKLHGAQLQKVWTDGQVIVLEVYLNKSLWLCFDLNPQRPYVCLLQDRPGFIIKKPKPVTLFLSAHGEGLRLENLRLDESRGRVLQARLVSRPTGSLTFGRSCEIEVWLIPKNVNLFVESAEKKISWAKPRELSTQNQGEFQNHEIQLGEKDWFAEGQCWAEEKKGRSKKSSAAVEADPVARFRKELQHSIEKKEKAIAIIALQLESGDEIRYQALGEVLKYSTDVPSELSALYDARLSRAQNREKCFQKAKDILRKRVGTRERFQLLLQEVEVLKPKLAGDNLCLTKNIVQNQGKKSTASAVLKKSDSSARKKVLNQGFEAVMGKSAKDNLAILRQARAWDIWLHLRDYPGAHAIIFKNKDQKIPDSVLTEAAQWVVDETISKKHITSGLKYDVILAECRHVKPVKGLPGLVTYQNSKTFTFASK